MSDPRLNKLANILIHHSIKIEPGEVVLIESIDAPQEMVIALIQAIRDAGAIPIVELKETRIQREIILAADDIGIKEIASCEAYRMQRVHGYIGLRGSRNISGMAGVTPRALSRYADLWLTPVHNIRMEKKWVVLQWPMPETAQQVQMSTEAFEDFFFGACLVDYAYMEQAVAPLIALMDATSEIHIRDENGTDLRFSITDMPVIPCTGERNMPDGECFTAPIRDSVNGTIHFNTTASYGGVMFNDIRVRFKNGKIVEASADDTTTLNKILDTDDGARYVGEFSIAFNPFIQLPVGNIHYDEKIARSFHIAIGMAYAESDNNVRSEIRWSLIMLQNPEYGGGEIYCDGALMRKDGNFVHPALEALNPWNFCRT